MESGNRETAEGILPQPGKPPAYDRRMGCGDFYRSYPVYGDGKEWTLSEKKRNIFSLAKGKPHLLRLFVVLKKMASATGNYYGS